MSRKSEVLIGRAREVATLDRLLSDTYAGAADAVFLSGEPGIGKTHLLGELVRLAERRGCLVLEGSAAEFEQELPFGVAIDALDAYLESLDEQSVDRLAIDGLQDLAHVFPALRSLRSTDGSPPTATERFRSYYAVRELLERLAARQPVVLILDDLHWADGASIELAAHLIRRPPEAPILRPARSGSDRRRRRWSRPSTPPSPMPSPASTSWSPGTWCGRRRCRAGSSSATRWCGLRCTSPRPRAPAWRPTESTAQRLPSTAGRWFQAALRLLPDTAPAAERAELAMCAASALTAAGRLDEARTVLVEAFEAVPRQEVDLRVRLTAACAGVEQQISRHDEADAHSVAWMLTNLSLSALMAGDLELAQRTSEESIELMGASGDSFVSALCAVVAGWVAYESGDPARAANLIVTGRGGADMPRIPGGWRATYLEVLARTYLDLGRPDDARLVASRAMETAEQVLLPRTWAMAHRAAAIVSLHDGDAARAAHHAQASVDEAEKCSARLDAAFSRVVLGRALAQGGDRAAASAELERAAADFDAYGAFRWRDRAEHELRLLGHRVHRRSTPGKAHGDGIDALSSRELEVARLVVNRRTNPEIAADLFLSLKTVESSHMRNIFRKLDVTSRVEVARLVERAPSA